jgi:hypothetical protein
MAIDKMVTRWWAADKDQAHKEVFATVRVLHTQSQDRVQKNLRSLRLYGNMDLTGLGPVSYSQTATPSMPENRVKLNIVSAMVDTSGAKISKMKPKVQFLTSGGDFTSQKQAKQLTKFMLGAFYQAKIGELHQMGFRDAQLFDVGAVKHFIENGKIVSERALPMELHVDPFDALYGKPRSLYQVKYVARDALCEAFPDKRAAIMSAKEDFETTMRTAQELEDFVAVVEAWHLGTDGRRVIVIGNESLLDEPYKRKYFPFTFFRWSKPVIGFWGQSLAERLTSLQLEINKMLRMIQQSFHLGSSFKVFLEKGSKISKEHINNQIGSIIYYMGKAPIYYTPQTVHPEYFAHLKFLVQSAYEETGISQMSAASRMPAGIDGASGRAVREYNNIESERFALVAQDYEASYLETADIYMDLAAEIAASGGDFGVTAQSKSFIEEIKWKDVAPASKNDYILQMFPVSALPHEPAGRLAFVQELITSGMIPASMGADLLDFPDIEAYMSIKNASIEDLLATLENLVDGEFVPPEPFQNLVAAVPFFQSAYLRARREKVSEKGLDNIRRWIAQADSMQSKVQATQAAQQPQPAPPGAPPQQGAPPTGA